MSTSEKIAILITIALTFTTLWLDSKRISTLEWKQMTPEEQCEQKGYLRGGQIVDSAGTIYAFYGGTESEEKAAMKKYGLHQVPLTCEDGNKTYTLQGSEWVHEDTVREVLVP